MHEYGNIDDAKPGDIVECISNSSNFTKGKLYIVSSNVSKWNPETTIMVTKDDIDSTTNGRDKEYFRLIKTRPGSEAKVGDTALCIKKSINCTEGDVYHITDREDLSTIVMLKDNNHTTCSSSSVYFRVLCKAEPVSTEKRNLAFYKRSGEPWTKVECENIVRYVGSSVQIKRKDWGKVEPTSKYMFDNGDLYTYMASWSRQEKDTNFKNCKQVAYEDIFKTPHPEENIDIFVPVFANTQFDYPDNCNICSEIPISPATPCSLPTPTIPEEEQMNTTENITISMTVKEYAKYTKVNTTKPKSHFEARRPFLVRYYDEKGMHIRSTENVKSLKAAKKLENNYLQDAKAGSTVTISKEISANKRQPAKLVKA